MQDKTNVMNVLSGLNRRRATSLIIVAAVILLAVGGFLAYRNHSKPKVYKSVAEASTAATQQDLGNKDYKSYQLRRSVDANDYINKGDYSNAEKTLNEVVKNVPQDKVISQTYRAYWSLYNKNGDVQNRKKYALLTAQKLKSEGQPDAAFAFEQDGKGN